MKSYKRLMALGTAAILFLSATNGAVIAAPHEDPAPQSPIASMGLPGYSAYRETYADAAIPGADIRIDGKGYLPDKSSGVMGENDGVYTQEKSEVRYTVEVADAGLYCLEIGYRTVEGKGSSIQRELKVNGAVPFKEAETIVLSRVFRNSDSGLTTDSRGNQYRPEQVEVFESRTAMISDTLGYITEPLKFYLHAGSNEITLSSLREPVVITHLRLYNPRELLSYKELMEQYESEGLKSAPNNATVQLQAENAVRKSDKMLCAVSDRTSPLTEPSDIQKVMLNTIGGYNWRFPGQWISWTVTVKETGLYELGFRFKQNFTEGQTTYRRLTVDGQVPFREAESIPFAFHYDWQFQTVGSKSPYLFYFEKGHTYTLTLENTLGDLAEVLEKTQQSVVALNDVYRQFKMIIGALPDANRDYGIDKQLPECMKTLRDQSAVLKELADQMEKLTGGKGNSYGTYQKLFIQIDSFLKDAGTIPARLSSFSSNISSLANTILTASEQPLTLDYLLVKAPGDSSPRAKETFWEKMWYELSSFGVSFVSDYNRIEDNADADRQVNLWLTSGRDQSQVLKQLADNNFTRKSGIGVNVRLVTGDVILPAVASGKGPDVAIGQEKALPVRYGMRNALYDLAQFADCQDVLRSFSPSAVESFYLENHLYALPDTQNFMLMYVRDDVLNSIGVKPPDTWDDLYATIFNLHQNNLDIGLTNITDDNSLDIFMMLLFQRGGELYTDDLSATRLDEQPGIEAFEQWAELYTKYKITEKMDHLTRFRTGEAPIVLDQVSFYNLLALSAPEIRGLWSVYPVPGMKNPDGTINRSTGSTPTGSVIFRNADNPKDCWEFLKWWTSAETQRDYSQEMESLQGASGRVITANLEAFGSLSWPLADAEIMEQQRSFIKGVPEIAGSYVVDRYLCTGIRYAIKNGGSAREILLDWNKKINIENQIRRKEFGLGTGKAG